MSIYFKPTWLYIKKHNKTGLMYFGKTQKEDPVAYLGSGKYWLKHIKKHGADITTLWCHLYTNKDELINEALSFSISHNITARNNNWANLKLENGIDGHVKGEPSLAQGVKIKSPRTDEWKLKQSQVQRGRPKPPITQETKLKLSNSSKGKVWWNNGIQCTKSITSPGPDWVRGRRLN